jgi:hypothetical protein
MAGTHTIVGGFTDGNSTLHYSYTFAYGDEWDAVDWDTYTPGVDGPDKATVLEFDLDGQASMWVVGPGTWRGVLYRSQGGARNEWRTTDAAFPNGVTAADGVLSFNTGGPVKTVGDLRGAQATRLDTRTDT